MLIKGHPERLMLVEACEHFRLINGLFSKVYLGNMFGLAVSLFLSRSDPSKISAIVALLKRIKTGSITIVF